MAANEFSGKLFQPDARETGHAVKVVITSSFDRFRIRFDGQWQGGCEVMSVR